MRPRGTVTSLLIVLFVYCLPIAHAQTTETLLSFEYDPGVGAPVAMRIYEVSRQTAGPMDRPLVVIEGIDLSQNPFGDFGRDEFELFFRSPVAREGPDLWDALLDQEYDLYLVDFRSFDHRLEDMAALLRLALFQGEGNIWSTRTSQSEPLIVVGASLGGVIGRLALWEAEQLGIDHHTEVFLSLDSPHKGAIIPLDIQAFVYFWSAYASAAAEQLAQLRWQSVKQILIRRQEGRFPPSFPTIDFDNFQAVYQHALPQGPRTMAVSNGSITGEEQILGNYGRVQFNFDFDPSGPGDFDSTLRSFNQFGGDIQYSRNHIGRGVISSETITMTLPFPNFENGPGGYRTTYRTVQQSITNGLEERCEDGLPDWCGEVPFGNIIGDGRHTFIPLASALDLDVDIKTREGVFAVPAPNVRSPFDALYTTPKNTEHVDLNAFYGPLLYEIGAEFQRTIYVDWDHPGEELGTPANPFRTVTRAHDFAWNGVTINIQSGVYPENVIFLKRVTVVTTGGLVTIGR